MDSLKLIEPVFIEYCNTHKSTVIPYLPLCEYYEFLNSKGYYKINETELSGWEAYFWDDFYNQDTKERISLQGSLYYGGFRFEYLTDEEFALYGDEENLTKLISKYN